MLKGLRVPGSALPIASLILCLTAFVLMPPAAANEVAQWNETTMKAIEANGQSAVVSTRTLTMVQVAVHDALNAISPRYDAYYFEGPGDPAASPDAAIAAAAHTVLVGVVGSYGTPAQKVATLALVDRAYAASIVRVTDGPARNKGVALGRAAGAAILTLRKDDGATRETRLTRRAWVPASGGRIRTPFLPTRPSPIRIWLAATCPRRFRAGVTSRRSPCCRPRSSGFPGRRR